MSRKEELLAELDRCVLEMEDDTVTGVAQEYVDAGYDAYEGITEGLSKGMEKAGQLYEEEEYFVPELLICSDAMYNGLDVLKPHLKASTDQGSKCPVIIGVVEGDTHDIGKNLVRMMMESKGLNVIDLGNSVPPAKYIEAAAKHNADIIACSALLTTTMVHIKDVVKGVAESPLAGKVKIMIGGAPVNDAFRESIGADYYTPDASSAAEKALEICAAARA